MMIYVRYSLSLSFFLHTKCTYSSQQSMAVQIFAEDERAERLSSRREYSTNSRLVKTCCFNWTFRPSLVKISTLVVVLRGAASTKQHLLCKAYFIFNSYINQVIYRSTMPPCHHATIALRSIRYPIAVLHRAGIDVVNGAE
jgi:hypothetical protein